ncbi:hypothetical protein OSG_eHP23_00130 [environmental Halophage eHP-23]|nr:hypothetical protein OSG_eHP23_00130 [environmental Halophage eHP-23]
MSFKFYYGAASGSSRKALRQLEEPNVMINYATASNKPWNSIENLFIDSGGYSFMLGKGEYATTDRKYLEFVEKHQPELFALRDYPCEPDVLEKNGRTVRDHLEATTEKHRNLLALLPEFGIKSQPVSVVQGWKLEDYLEHLEMLKQHDLLTDYVAIGSVCRRNQDEEIRRIINEVHKRIGDRKLHAFGVKSNILRFQEMQDKLDSADSMAYEHSEQFGQRVSGTERKSFRDSALAYLKFKKNINSMLNSSKSEKQTTLQQL